MATIGERIRDWRARRSYGQAELARAVGITPNTLYRIETEGRTPRPATIRKIADILQVSVENLLSDPQSGTKDA